MPWTTCPARRDDDCLQELRWIYDRRDLQEAQRDLAVWIGAGRRKYPKLIDWAETNIGETLTFYRLPRPHHKHLKSTNMLERLNEEIKRRTRVVRIFPNTAILPATGPSAVRRDPRDVAGGQPLLEHGPATRGTQRSTEESRIDLRPRPPFAQLDEHNPSERRRSVAKPLVWYAGASACGRARRWVSNPNTSSLRRDDALNPSSKAETRHEVPSASVRRLPTPKSPKGPTASRPALLCQPQDLSRPATCRQAF